MIKKRIAPISIDNTPDLLVKSKKQFETELTERIQLGENMMNRQIMTNEAFIQIWQDYTPWNEYNAEFIKRAFNRADSKFFKDYTYVYSPGIYVGSMFGTVHQPTLQESIAEIKSKIEERVKRLKLIHGMLPLIDEDINVKEQVESISDDIQLRGLKQLAVIFSKFHKVAQSLRHRHGSRETLIIKDEYDVQDLLNSLLQINFDDIRPEDYSPSYAGANSRTDFVLKDEKIIVEVKMTNDHLADREVGNQLLIDIGRYRAYPDCKVLVMFVYDKGDHIRNKVGLINDLERMSTPQLTVKVYIHPR